MGIWRPTIAALLCASLLTGCATAGAPRYVMASQAPRVQPSPQLLGEYVTQLPIGSRVQVDVLDGPRVKGTLMKASEALIVVQPRTRVPEPPVEIPLDRIRAVELDRGNSTAKTAGIALAAGAAGTLAILLFLAAVLSD